MSQKKKQLWISKKINIDLYLEIDSIESSSWLLLHLVATNASKRARVNDLRTTMTFMAITVPKAVSRETFLEMRFTTIRRTLVKVPSYNTRVSQCGSLRIRWFHTKNGRGGQRKTGEERETKKSARCYATCDSGVGVHLVLSQRESDVTVCRYKGDSKSEQMSFIVDHRPRRRSPTYIPIILYGIAKSVLHLLLQSVSVADVERGHNSKSDARQISAADLPRCRLT